MTSRKEKFGSRLCTSDENDVAFRCGHREPAVGAGQGPLLAGRSARDDRGTRHDGTGRVADHSGNVAIAQRQKEGE